MRTFGLCDADLVALAAGRPSAATLGELRRAQISRHLLQLREWGTLPQWYAEATAGRVSVRTADGQVSVCVQDDGVGTDPARARGGLVNLQDRAQDLGGTFELLPSPGGGTLIDWRVPLTG